MKFNASFKNAEKILLHQMHTSLVIYDSLKLDSVIPK